MKLTLVLILSLAAVFEGVTAVCNVCNSNGVACISKNQFYLCQNHQPKNTTIYTCPTTKICTQFDKICMQPTDTLAKRACGDTSNCGICAGPASDGTYACTSRRNYSLCFDGNLSDIQSTCPQNQMCDINLGKKGKNPCVPNCRQPEIEFCDALEIDDKTDETTKTTETTISTTKISPVNEKNLATQFCKQALVGRYHLTSDTTCKFYILCLEVLKIKFGQLKLCIGRTYFNPATTLCEATKPQGCE